MGNAAVLFLSKRMAASLLQENQLAETRTRAI